MILAGIVAAKSKAFVVHLNVLSNNNLSHHWEVSFLGKSSQRLLSLLLEANKHKYVSL